MTIKSAFCIMHYELFINFALMETTEIKKAEIVKARTVWDCMSDGLSAAFEYMGASLRGLWPLIIIFSLVAPALFLLWVGKFYEQLFDGTIMAAFTGHNWNAILRVLAVSGLLFVIGLMDAILHGGIVWRQRQLTAMGYIPRTQAWREGRGIGRMTWRMIVIALLVIVLTILLSVVQVGATIGLGLVISHWTLSPAWSVALTIVLTLVFLILMFYFLTVLLHMVLPYVYEDVPLRRSIASASWSLRTVSGTFAVYFVAGIAALLFGLIFALPTVVIQIVDLLAMKATLMGDAATLPSSMSVWRYITMALTFLGSFVCNVIVLYPILYRWGALKSREPKKEEEIS